MDPITAFQVAAAVVAFADISAKIVKRLLELSEAGDVPQSFRDIRTRLPLMRSLVISTERTCGSLSPEVQEAFDRLVQDCHTEMAELEKLLMKYTVSAKDSRVRKGIRATTSIFEDNRVQRIAVTLQTNVELLMAIKTTSTELEKPPPPRRPSEAPPPPYSSATSVFLLPFARDEHFVGRSDVLQNISRKLQIQSRVAVAGIGGVGKSQVAIEFGYRFQHENPDAHVFWVYGGSIARFYQGYKRIAQALALPSWDDPDVSILGLVSDWFKQTTTDFLLIVDNADDITHWWPGKYRSPSGLDDPSSNLSNFLPEYNDRGRVLVTSRDTRVAERLQKQGKPIPLETMTADEAQQLFISLALSDGFQFEEKEVQELVKELDYLPLAISQAASFIDSNTISISEYFTALQSAEVEEFLYDDLNDSRRDKDNVNSVFRTWKLSFDNIVAQKPAAAELLSLMAMLDRQSVPKWLLKGKEITTSLGILRAFHLISISTGSQSFQMHRLVQLFVRLTLKQEGTLQKWQEAALRTVSQSYPIEIGVAEWPVCDALAPHVQLVTSYEYSSTESRLELAHLLCWAADFDIERGMYVQALRRAKQSLEIFQELVPEKDNRRAAATWMYGRLQYYEAESDDELNRAAKTLNEALRISTYPSLNYAETAFELAHLYFDQCNKEGCLKMGRASFECWKAIEGASSVRTLDNMHDFALELALFGHVEEALANWQEIVNHCDGAVTDASDNTKTIYTYRSMACIAEFEGDASMAESFYKKLITLCTAIYNPQHAHVFDYRLTHAEQVLRQGRLEEAIQLSHEIRGSCENKSEWQIRASSLQTLAECCRIDHKFDTELVHRLESLELHESKLGRKHKITVDELEAYGRCCLSNGNYKTATEVFAEILDWRAMRLESTHKEIIRIIECQGICCMGQERDDEAESRFLDALDRQGGTDSRLLDNLNASLANQGKWEEVETRCRQALASGIEQSPQAQRDLIIALEQQAKVEEAMALRADQLALDEANIHQSGSRRQPKHPPVPAKPRFGRMIHPRTWSA